MITIEARFENTCWSCDHYHILRNGRTHCKKNKTYDLKYSDKACQNFINTY